MENKKEVHELNALDSSRYSVYVLQNRHSVAKPTTIASINRFRFPKKFLQEKAVEATKQKEEKWKKP
jgi:hypothetical protein